MRYRVHSKSMYKGIMNLGASKHMTSYKAAFGTYKVIDLRGLDLGDNNVVKVIGMGSIVMETIMKGKINCIRIKDVLHVSKLHADLLLVNRFLLTDWRYNST